MISNSSNHMESQQQPTLVAVRPTTANPASRATKDRLAATSITSAIQIQRQQSLPTKISPRSSKRLRSGLLNKLGMQQHDKIPPKRASRQLSILGPAATKIIKAPLKGSYCEDPPRLSSALDAGLLGALGSLFSVGSPSSIASTASITDDDSVCDQSSLSSSSLTPSPTTTAAAAGRRRCLTFDEEVSIVSIPRREQYSNRMQQHLWHPTELLQVNIMRNTIEYAADGWSWQQVREEEDHIYCAGNGEYIHPVHKEIARLIRREQGLPEGAPVPTPFLKDDMQL